MLRVSGASLDALGEKFNAHRDAIWRHMRNHVSEDVKAQYLCDVPLSEMAARAAEESVSLLDHFLIIRRTLMQQLVLAGSVNDRFGLTSVSGRAIEVLKEIGKLTGEMSRISSVNITNNTALFVNSPIFADLQTMLLERLQGHPEALQSVVQGLRELEAKSAPAASVGPLIDGRALEHAA